MSVVCVFGPLSVRRDGRVLQGNAFGGRKPRQLLALLAMRPGCPMSRDDLAEALWDGRPPRGYVTTVHGYVSVLRRGLAGIAADDVLVTAGHGYVLDGDRVSVDLVHGHELLETGEPEAVLDALELAAPGLLVDEPDAEWALQVRREWHELVALAATRAAAVSRERGEPSNALRLARAALRASPWCEAALVELLGALAESGQVGRALQSFVEFRSGLRADLGVEPHPDTQRVYLDLLRGAPASSVEEIPVLVRLLREALAAPGAPAGADDPAMRDVGRLLLERAG